MFAEQERPISTPIAPVNASRPTPVNNPECPSYPIYMDSNMFAQQGELVCYSCNKPGHMSRNCPERAQPQQAPIDKPPPERSAISKTKPDPYVRDVEIYIPQEFAKQT